MSDQVYMELKQSLPDLIVSHLHTVTESSEDSMLSSNRIKVNGRVWHCATDAVDSDLYDVLYIGGESRTLSSLMMCMTKSTFYTYNPATLTARKETLNINKQLMKRFFMVEKAKDANIVGIVMSTMSIANHMAIHNRLKKMIVSAGK